MIKKLISIMTAVCMLSTCFVPAVMAEGEEGTKPEDYGRVLFLEDHESGAINMTNFDKQDVDTVENSPEKGYYVNICNDGSAQLDSIYRPKYGNAKAPVQASGVAKSELSKMQFSIDVCVTVPRSKGYTIKFYDKWTTGSTVSEELIYVGKNGNITFPYSSDTYPCAVGEWMTIDTYMDFDTDTYSVYVDGVAAALDQPLKSVTTCCESAGFPVGKTSDEFGISVDNFRIAIPAPPAPDPGAFEDYGRVLFFEDHESGTINATTFDKQDVDTVKSCPEKGYYVDICNDGSTQLEAIYRPKYGSATSPVQSNANSIAELSKMQISMDLRAVVPYKYSIRFYDKWSGSSTKGETLICLNSNGTITFANTDETYDYTIGEWIEIDTFLDFETDTYSVFINGEAAVADVPLLVLTECCESAGIPMGKTSNEFSLNVDNIRIAIPGEPIVPDEPDVPDVPDEPDVPDVPDVPLGDDKPADYNRVLLMEDHEDGVLGQGFEAQDVSKVVSGGDAEGSAERGYYVDISTDGPSVNAIYRPTYGTATSPVRSTGIAMSDMKLTQVSLDICPVLPYNYTIRFYDKWSTGSTIGENFVLVNKDGTLSFSNTSTKYNFTFNKWMKIDVYINFASDTYSVYVDGKAVVTDITNTTLKDCVESVGIVTGQSKEGTPLGILADNFRIAIPEKFAVKETYPANGVTDADILDDIKIVLTEDAADFDKADMLFMCDGDEVGFDAVEDNGVITVTPDGGLDFGNDYTILLANTFKDVHGQTLDQPYIFGFTTSDPKVTATVPSLGTTAVAKVYNPNITETVAMLVLTVINADGTSTVYTNKQTIAPGNTANFAVNYDIASLGEGQSVMAYVTNDASTLKPMRSEYITADGIASFGSGSQAEATITEVKTGGNKLNISGSISVKEKQLIMLAICDETDNAIAVVPVNTDEKGEFTYEYNLDSVSSGLYRVSATGASITQTADKKFMHLDNTTKGIITSAINGATDATAVKNAMAAYKTQIYIDDKYYCNNTYTVLAQQGPFASYDDMLAMIYKAESLLTQINAADWSKYSSLLTTNSDVVLYGAEKLDKYLAYSANKKNSINKLIINSSPFADFDSLVKAFDKAVEKYEKSSSEQSSGGSGGGSSSGGSSSGGVSSTINVSAPVIADNNTNNEANNVPQLFVDMSDVPWAQEHVKQLCTLGIVSEAANYRPLDNVTREEFVKMLVQLAGLAVDANAKPAFTDVAGNEWFAPYLAAAQNAGIVNGGTDGAFGAGNSITRQDMVVMAQRTVEAMNKTLNMTVEAVDFADGAQISGYAVNAVGAMQRAGVISGTGNGNFEPMGIANRAQAAVIICNLTNAIK